MVRHSRICSHQSDNLGYDFHGLNRTQTQALQAGNFQHPANQFIKRGFSWKVAANTTEMDSGKDHFIITAGNQISYFVKSRIGFIASASPSNRWNNAKRAIRVAAVLLLNNSPRSAAGTEM